MNSEKIGTILKKNTKTKLWWFKLAISLILSNIFFFLLFGEKKETKIYGPVPMEEWVEVHLEADSKTPIVSGKKILIVNAIRNKKIEGFLLSHENDESGKVTVKVKEKEAHDLFKYQSWQILPYIKDLTFNRPQRIYQHEINY